MGRGTFRRGCRSRAKTEPEGHAGDRHQRTGEKVGWTDASHRRVASNPTRECLGKSRAKTGTEYGDPTISVVNLEVV